jgi:hypothetical protein
MGFEPCNHLLKIRESIGTLTPNMGVHLGVWGFIPSHSLALLGECDVTLGFFSWHVTLQPFALLASSRLGLQQWLIWHFLHFQITTHVTNCSQPLNLNYIQCCLILFLNFSCNPFNPKNIRTIIKITFWR